MRPGARLLALALALTSCSIATRFESLSFDVVDASADDAAKPSERLDDGGSSLDSQTQNPTVLEDAGADAGELHDGETTDAGVELCGEHVCQNEHGSTSCHHWQCEPICEPGWASCDLLRWNGCETPIDPARGCP